MADAKSAYENLMKEIREIALINSTQSVLWWDERVNMPPKGSRHRGNMMALMARMSHERFTSPRIKELVATLKDSELAHNGNSEVAANIREVVYSFEKMEKVPKEWVEEYNKTTTESAGVWVKARRENDFKSFLPYLKKIIEMKKQYAEFVGYGKDPYDALIDNYETGATFESISKVFDGFRGELVELVERIRNSGVSPRSEILTREYPVQLQEKFGKEASAAIGYDYEGGRLDVTAHPFCSGFGPGDVRITTRYNSNFFPMAFFGIMHEAGHGIYNQNLPAAHYGTPLGQAVSLGIHESQSRMWENLVGRNRETWKYFYPMAQRYFPEALKDVSEDEFYFAINEVKPSLIRVEADEVTYNLHIILRFEMEHDFFSGELKPEDIPAAWDEKFEKFFGITPPNDSDGCMQDIHWSSGMIGYFPTYALGNLYAAQFFARAKEMLPGLEENFARGQFAPLKTWLTENIHSKGKLYRAEDLVEVVTGKKLSHEPMIKYLKAKFAPLYHLQD